MTLIGFAIWLFALGYFAFAGFVIVKINRSIVLTKKQKRINIALIVLVPIIWTVLMFYILKKEPNYFDKRKHITNDQEMTVHSGGLQPPF